MVRGDTVVGIPEGSRKRGCSRQLPQAMDNVMRPRRARQGDRFWDEATLADQLTGPLVLPSSSSDL